MPSRVAEILLEQGRQAAEAARARGQVWGGAVQNLAQIPGQVMAQHQQQERQALQNQVTQQGLAVGAEQLRGLQDVHRDQSLYADVVGKNTSTDPETGHVVFNNDAILQGLASRPNALERWTDFSTKFQEHSDKAQLDHLALEGTKNTLLTDMLGGVLSAPPDQQADVYAARSGALKGILKNDPRVAQLPPVYDQKQVQALHDAFLTEGQRLAQAKDKAALAKENRVTTKPGETVVDVSQIDPATGQPKVLASGGADPSLAERERHNKEIERIDTLKVGKEAAAQAETARHNRAMEDQKNKPADDLGVSTDIRTTSTGRTYIDGSKYKGKDYAAARTQAHAEGAYLASAPEADALQNIETARTNMALIAKHLDQLPSSAVSRAVVGPLNVVKAGTQWDADLASWGTWRTAAIQAMRALAGSKGLRINRSEIEASTENDIPKVTDTLATAKAKLAKVDQMLKSQEDGVMGGAAAAPKEIVYDANGQPVKR